MIGYSERTVVCVGPVVDGGNQIGTASDHVVTNEGIATFPLFPRNTQIHKIIVKVATAPNAGSVASHMIFRKGTSALATATIGTLTAGQTVKVDAVDSLVNRFSETDVFDVDIVGTATASSTIDRGNYEVYVEV